MNTTPDNLKTTAADFKAMLVRMRRSWQRGLLVRDGIRLAGEIAVVLAVYGVADYFIAVPDAVRVVLGIGLLAGFALLVAIRTTQIFLLTNKDMAARADTLLQSRRHAVLSAFELEAWTNATGPLDSEFKQFLIQRSIDEAGAALRRLSARDYYPGTEIRRQLKSGALKLLGASALFLLNPGAGGVILGRIVLPWYDIPPYSRYTFAVTPATPSVLYGGTAELAVEIKGGAVTAPVTFLSRYQGEIRRAACFQESSHRYAQRLEKVTSPVDVCFTMGKVRSRWTRVQVIFQPIIAMAYVSITPPEYTGLPKRQFFAGTESVLGVRGSRVELAVTSNRPLLDGTLTFKSKNGSGRNDAVVTGARTGVNTVTFSWLINEPAELQVVVRDLLGTKNRDPYKLDQKVLPDEAPEAVITEPASFALATPTVVVTLKGYAADDFGLRRVNLLQTVVGYRDRARFLGPDVTNRRVDFSVPLDLKAIGAEVGQVLEFYIEAMDQNPLLTGATASDTVRIQIISEEEYASILRTRTTVDDFANRYRQIADQLEVLKKTLRDLKQAVESGTVPPAELEKQIEKATQQHRETIDMYAKMNEDFPIFDADQGLAAALEALIRPLRQNETGLANANASDPNLAQSIGNMLERLTGPEKTLTRETQRAADIERVARLMESAAEFKKLVARQSALVRRLGRFEEESGKDLPMLAALGRNQDDIRVALDDFMKALKDRAGQVPEEYNELRDSALEFSEQLEKLKVSDTMKSAVTAAGNQNGRQTSREARHALEKLQQLMKGSCDSEFGGMCQGGLKFDVREDMKKTLEQMLCSLMAPGKGSGQGQAAGAVGGGMAGGDINDGYWMGSSSPINIPLIGPSRTVPSGPSMTGSGQGGNKPGPSCPGVAPTTVTAEESLKLQEKGLAGGESLPIENIPDKYRDAVKRYFSQEEKAP